jgi:hypothetical protein
MLLTGDDKVTDKGTEEVLKLYLAGENGTLAATPTGRTRLGAE